MYVDVKSLPAPLVAFLKGELDFHRPAIELVVVSEISPQSGGGDGVRAFFAAFNLVTGERDVKWGSYGGANIFNPNNRVDLDSNSYTIPPNVVVIKGVTGGGRSTLASLYARPESLHTFTLAAPAESLTDAECIALYAFKAIKAGPYRAAYLKGVSEDVLTGLISRGFLKQNGGGARQITTAGKNALVAAKGERWQPSRY